MLFSGLLYNVATSAPTHHFEGLRMNLLPSVTLDLFTSSAVTLDLFFKLCFACCVSVFHCGDLTVMVFKRPHGAPY